MKITSEYRNAVMRLRGTGTPVDSNPYHDPDKWNLEIVASIDYSDGNYHFNKRVVWRCLITGVYVTAHHSGCSCPSPFENIKTWSDFEDYNYNSVRREALEKAREGYYAGGNVEEFLRKLPR